MKAVSRIFTLVFFASQLFLSCKKDRDAEPPLVSVFSPAENNSFAVFDTIKVNAEISDERQLAAVTVQLMQENLTPAQSLFRKTISGKNYLLNSDYIIYDSQLSSAFYFLKITASDGENETKKYVKVYISESASKRQGIFIISTPTDYTVNVSILDSNFSAALFLSRNCDYTSSCLSSKYQYLNLLGSKTCGLTSFRINDKVSQWSEASLGSTSPFTHLDFYNEISYVCDRNGNIRGFDKNGALQFNAVCNTGYYPLRTFLYNDVLYAEERELSADNRRLSVFYNTGAFARSVSLPAKLVAFAGKDNNNIFLFGNDNGTGKIMLYNISENEIGLVYSVQSLFNDAVKINSGTYLVALQDGVYKYEYSPQNFVKLINQQGVEKLRYDEENNTAMAAGGTSLGTYSASSGQLVSMYHHTEIIKDFHLLYDK